MPASWRADSVKRVASHERVLVPELVVEPRADRGAVLRREHGQAQRLGGQGRVEDGGVDDLVVVDVPAGEVHEERPLLGERPAQAGVPLPPLVRRPVRREGVAGVERLVHELEGRAAAQPVGAGLGQDLDAPEAEPVVLGGERVGVEPDLADRLLGRHAAAGEPVDEELATAGTRGGPGQGLQRFGQLVGVVGERIEIVALEDDAARALARVQAERRLALDRRRLLDRRQLQLRVEGRGRARRHRHVALCERREAGPRHQHQVRARRSPTMR